MASYKAISSENDIVFTQRLVKEYGVAAVPLSPFYGDGRDLHCIRFCFAKEESTLEKAAENLLHL